MDYLDKVRDGSEGEMGRNLGYNGCMAVACERGARRMMPLLFRLWSCRAPDFQSENTEVEAVVDAIASKTEGRGIYVYDRGGDRIGLFERLLDKDLRFIVRLVGNRNLVWRRKTVLAEKLANKCRMLYGTSVTFLSHGREAITPIQFGAMEVALPDKPETPLRLVVVQGFGKAPMMLLTNLRGTKSYRSLWKVVEGYVTRWRVEEALRFIKQAYRLEEMRVLTYERLKNMAALVACAAHFASVWMGMGERLKILVAHVVELSQRIHKVLEFSTTSSPRGSGGSSRAGARDGGEELRRSRPTGWRRGRACWTWDSGPRSRRRRGRAGRTNLAGAEKVGNVQFTVVLTSYDTMLYLRLRKLRTTKNRTHLSEPNQANL